MTDKSVNNWGASVDLDSLSFSITEDEVREAFSVCFNSLAWKIVHIGGYSEEWDGGEWDGKYVNAIPTRIEIEIHRDNDFRKLVIKCISDGNFLEVLK